LFAGLCGTVFSACASPGELSFVTTPTRAVVDRPKDAARPVVVKVDIPPPVWPEDPLEEKRPEASASQAGKAPAPPPDFPAEVAASVAGPAKVDIGNPAAVEGEVIAAKAEETAPARTVEETPLLSALRSLMAKKPEQAVADLRTYEQANQELLLRLLPLAVRCTEGNLQEASAKELATCEAELDGMTASLRSRSPLVIGNMCFCRRIVAYGVYEPLPADYRFRPGDLVEVYAELRNFASRKRQNAKGETSYVIELASSFEIRDFAGNTVHREVFHRRKPDESRAERHDYFDNYQFYVPAIPPGAYTLVIRVEDLGTRPSRKASRSLDFAVTNLPGTGVVGP
jgi:hypothetical protein